MRGKHFNHLIDADRDDDDGRLLARQNPDLRNLFAEMRASPLIRFLVVNLAGGIVLATLTLGGLLVLNPRGLRTLLFADGSSWLAAALLLFGFVVTLGSFAMGTAVMGLGQKDE
jgi:hypothetical protein